MALLDDLRRELNSIEEAARIAIDHYELAGKILSAHRHFKCITPVLLPGRKIYRATTFLPEGQKPQLVSQVGAPPWGKAKLGRANLSGVSMFYGSLASDAPCVYEVGGKVGHAIVLSVWEVTKPLVLHSFGYANRHARELRSKLQKPPFWSREEGFSEADELLRGWQSKWFTEPDETSYRLTTALTDALCGQIVNGGKFQAREFCGCLYPSVASKLFADNVALNPRAYISRIKFLSCNLVRLLSVAPREEIRHNKRLIRYQVLDVCTSVELDENLIWDGPPTQQNFTMRHDLTN